MRYHVIEALMRIYFSCSEETFDQNYCPEIRDSGTKDEALPQYPDGLDATASSSSSSSFSSRDQTEKFHKLQHVSLETIWSRLDGDACSYMGPKSVFGLKYGTTMDWDTLIQIQDVRTSATNSARADEEEKWRLIGRIAMAGGSYAATSLQRYMHRMHDFSARSPNDSDGDGGDRKEDSDTSPQDPVHESEPAGFRILPHLDVLAEKDRSLLPGHGQTHCVCCICESCIVTRRDATSTHQDGSKSVTLSMRLSNASLAGMTREDCLSSMYADNSTDGTINEAEVATRLKTVLDLKDLIPSTRITMDESDSPERILGKRERINTANQAIRGRYRRARHLQKKNYQVLEGAYKDTHVLSPNQFTASMSQSQCRSQLTRMLHRRVPGFSKGAISSVVNDLCNTQVQCRTPHGIKYTKALVLNDTMNGIIVAKHIMTNNRDQILRHITRDLLEHRHTIGDYTHLFGPSSDPRAEPYIFETFNPMAQDIDPPPMRGRSVPIETLRMLSNTQDPNRNRLIFDAHNTHSEGFTKGTPSVRFWGEHIATLKHSDENVILYGFVPANRISQLEEKAIQNAQAKWDVQFQDYTERFMEEFDGQGQIESVVRDAFAKTRAIMGSRPKSMISYPPTRSRDQVQSATLTNHQLALKWGWESHLVNALDVAENSERNRSDVEEEIGQTKLSTTEYLVDQYRKCLDNSIVT